MEHPLFEVVGEWIEMKKRFIFGIGLATLLLLGTFLTIPQVVDASTDDYIFVMNPVKAEDPAVTLTETCELIITNSNNPLQTIT